MKKILRTSMIYMIIGLAFGVFYREFTKFNNFTDWTQLKVLHTHTLTLGMFFFLILLLFEKNFNLTEHKNYNKFFIFYNLGLIITLSLMLIHGTMTVLGYNGSAAISGIAGLGHIILTVGLYFLFTVFNKQVTK